MYDYVFFFVYGTQVSNNVVVGDIVGLVIVVDLDNVDFDFLVQIYNCFVGGDGLGVFIIDYGFNNLKVCMYE